MNVQNKKQELQSIEDQFAVSEAGVTDLMDLYENIEDIYIRASVSMSGIDVVHTSNSTNSARANAYLGRNPKGT